MFTLGDYFEDVHVCFIFYSYGLNRVFKNVLSIYFNTTSFSAAQRVHSSWKCATFPEKLRLSFWQLTDEKRVARSVVSITTRTSCAEGDWWSRIKRGKKWRPKWHLFLTQKSVCSSVNMPLDVLNYTFRAHWGSEHSHCSLFILIKHLKVCYLVFRLFFYSVRFLSLLMQQDKPGPLSHTTNLW